MRRLVVWAGTDEWRAEAASVELLGKGVKATGTQIGRYPAPYRLDYELDAADNFITRNLEVAVTGDGWWRRLSLTHDGNGGWSCDASQEGGIDLPSPGGDMGAVEGALDCDLGLSPMTNLMPVRRHRLHERPGEVSFRMAWVSVPALAVHLSKQRYEHVRRGEDRSVVRYVGEHRSYVGELVVDVDGLVLVYPDLARRVDLRDDGSDDRVFSSPTGTGSL
ncbi:MAG: putative glycolipid-binding domain-containing protein [Actinomycetota bacterium]|nr:putative glycolipid-binding domain-containing protein [Actinomycetota bacterium]